MFTMDDIKIGSHFLTLTDDESKLLIALTQFAFAVAHHDREHQLLCGKVIETLGPKVWEQLQAKMKMLSEETPGVEVEE